MFNSLNMSKSNNQNYLTLEIKNKYASNSIEKGFNFTKKKTFKKIARKLI